MHQYTEWEQRFHIGELKTIDQFRERIPILPYSSYESDVERIANGEMHVLNPDPVVYINSTETVRTGYSTGGRKPLLDRLATVANLHPANAP